MFAWAGDEQMVSLWKSYGFQPVALAATDIMTGLQTGMIDAYPTTPLLGLTLQWYRLTPHMVSIGLAPLVGGLVMTRQAWNRIGEADRAKILQGCARLEHRLEVDVPRQDTTAVAEMTRRGLKVMRVSATNAAEFRATAEQFAQGMQGLKVPADVLDLARRERDAFRRRDGGAR
jgi:TRAP-type C4-dicarboxylate transport system substrate-binding protein